MFMLRTRLSLALLTALLLLPLFPAQAFKVAILMVNHPSQNEFDPAAKELGWETEKFLGFENFQRLIDRLDEFNLVIAPPLFQGIGENFIDTNQYDMSAFRRFMENGGAIVMTDATYANVRAWVESIGPEFGRVGMGNCNSSQWHAAGFATNNIALHPLRSFPYPFSEPNTWGHFQHLPEDSPWEVITRCSEGFPIVLLQHVGKGFIIMTNKRWNLIEPLKNIECYQTILSSGLDIDKVSLSPLKPGPVTFYLSTKTEPPPQSRVALRVTDENKKVWNAIGSFKGKECSLSTMIEARGNCTVEIFLSVNQKTIPLLTQAVFFPPVFELFPNQYRGILSTARREKTVDFLLRFAPARERLTNATVNFAVFDAENRQLLRSRVRTPSTPVDRMWAPIALPADLPPGTYTLRAILTAPATGFTARAQTEFEIVAPEPAQVIIDDDGTFLVSGKPYFPLGIYHMDNEFEKMAELGFNACQFWKWQDDGTGSAMTRALDNGFMCLYESHHGNLPDIREKYSKHPALLMWYAGDEPDEGATSSIRNNTEFWHVDRNHPSFINSCRDDLFPIHVTACDVLGFNPGGSSLANYLKNVEHFIKTARAASDGHKALILVPGALSPNSGAWSKPSAYMAIVHDIRGIFWYCWKQVGGGPIGVGLNQYEESQRLFKDTLTELRQLLPFLVTPNRRTFEEGPVHGIVCANNAPGKRIAILFNTTGETQKAAIRLRELANASQVANFFTGKPVSAYGGIIRTELAPFDRLVLRW